jgi:hypothetical protein
MSIDYLKELQYLTDERLGILLQGQRQPTAEELNQAHREALTIIWRRGEQRMGVAQKESITLK